MDRNSLQKISLIPELAKKLLYTNMAKREESFISTRMVRSGTQLFKIADELLKAGYSTVSFDAPAHGNQLKRYYHGRFYRYNFRNRKTILSLLKLQSVIPGGMSV
jgi:hypothetical protein